ncbi:MAG: hypothetical protein ACC641_08615 [Acidiferrobacterales bacterium]
MTVGKIVAATINMPVIIFTGLVALHVVADIPERDFEEGVPVSKPANGQPE